MRMRSATNIQANKIRVLVFGASGVGKSTLIRHFTQKTFIEDFEDYNIQENGTIIVELMEVDVSLLLSLKRLAIKTAHAYVLLYSIEDLASFEFIQSVKQEIIETKGEGMPIVVVGNKIDLPYAEMRLIGKTSEDAASLGLSNTGVHVSLHTGMNIGVIYRNLFSHPTLQRLVCIVAVINTSSVSASIRRMSLPVLESQRAVSRPNITMTELTCPEVAILEVPHCSQNSIETGKQTVQGHAHRTSRWLKFKQFFTGRTARK